MRTKSQILLVFLPLLFGGNLIAQSNTVSAGGEASGGGGTVSFTVGQIDYTSQSGSSGSVHQGVQQPLEFFNLTIAENELDFTVQLFPNPVVAQLHVDLSGASLDRLSYNLTDATGRLVAAQKIETEQINIDMTELSRANYFLNFTKNGKIVGSYQIIKN
ncbi:MAG: T9SS type A sorting domain-containing protein [Crocinitomicaceae bacterium]